MHPTLKRILECPTIDENDKNLMVEHFKNYQNDSNRIYPNNVIMIRLNTVSLSEVSSTRLIQNTFVHGDYFMNYYTTEAYKRIQIAFTTEQRLKITKRCITLSLPWVIGIALYFLLK